MYRADTINTYHFARSLVQIRFSNMENIEIKMDLLEIFNSDSFKDEFVQSNMPVKNAEDFNEEILKNITENENVSKETMIKRLKRTINKENTDDKRKISKIKAQNLALELTEYFNLDIEENLIRTPSKLKETFENKDKFNEMIPICLKSEKPIKIIIDNFSVHKTYISKIVCRILNIELIFLPKYSPFLNPIEQLWRTMKREIHKDSIPNKNYLKKIADRLYYELVDKPSFFKEWNETFIAKK